MGSDIVILVVGDEWDKKSRLANEIALRAGAAYLETTPAGVRIHTGVSRNSWTVVDTTPFLGKEDAPFKNARQWISQNSLRRLLFKKFVFVVCVVSSSVAHPMSSSFEIHKFGWLDTLGVLFKDHKGGMKICVNTAQVQSVDMAYMKLSIEYVLDWHGFTAARDITYADISTSAVELATLVVDYYRLMIRKSRERRGVTISPFLLELASDKTKRESIGGSYEERVILFGSYGPWGPERVVLFGSDGSGKSTLARMLTKGSMEKKSHWHSHSRPLYAHRGDQQLVAPSSSPFRSSPSPSPSPSSSSPVSSFSTPYSSASTSARSSSSSSADSSTRFSASRDGDGARSGGADGDTRKMTQWEGRGWHVVDTPPFVDPRDEFKNRPSQEDAEKRIKEYVMSIQGMYSHFLVVIRKDRVHELDKRLWHFFRLLFGAEVREYFSIVVTDADREWLEDNMQDLRTAFPGCRSFLAAEFPDVMEDDEEWEAELQKVRRQCLKDLENSLAALSRSDTYCHIGEYVAAPSVPASNIDAKSQNHAPHGTERQGTLKDTRRGSERQGSAKESRQRAMGTARQAYSEVSVSMSSLTNALKLRDSIALLPAFG